MTGRELLANLDSLKLQGIGINPNGPGARIILDRETCTRLATTPR